MAQTKIADEEKLLFRFERAKYGIQQLVERVGFFGILAAARSALLSPSYLPYLPPFQHSKPPRSLVLEADTMQPLVHVDGVLPRHHLHVFRFVSTLSL